MNRGKLSSLFALAWFGTATLGCASGPAQPTTQADPGKQVPVAFVVADDYDATFDAAVRELRDAGFRIARNDRRFGVITTWPKESPTAFEPWVGDNATGDMARRSTLNHLRRSVGVTIKPNVDLDIALSSTPPPVGSHPTTASTYTLTVAVTLERRQQPNRYLTHSVSRSIAASYDEVPAHLAQRGIPASYWEPAGDDPQLAVRLLGVIRDRAGLTLTPEYDDEDTGQADEE